MGLNRSTIAGLVTELEALALIEHDVPATGRRGAGRPSAGVRIRERRPVRRRRRPRRRPGRGGPGRPGRPDLERARPRRSRDEPEAWQVGATVAGLIRHVVSSARRTRAAARASASPCRAWCAAATAWSGTRPTSTGTTCPSAPSCCAALSLDVPDRARQRRRPRCARRAPPRRGRRASTTWSTSPATSVSVPASSPAAAALEGVAGYAGEVGHLYHDPRGLACHCGSRGCWETVVGAHAIAASAALPGRPGGPARRDPRRHDAAAARAAADRDATSAAGWQRSSTSSTRAS